MIQKTTELANGTLKMNVLGGAAQPGVDTATEADQQIRNASAKLSGPVNAEQRLVEILNRWALMDIDLLLEAAVTVFGGSLDTEGEVTLGPKDINGFYETSVEMRTTDADAVAQVKARFWAEMYRVVPFLSAFTAMERGEITDNPFEELVKRGSEDTYLSEEFRMMRVLAAAMAYGQEMSLVRSMQQGPMTPGAQPPTQPGAGSDMGLMESETLQAPAESRTVANAYEQRDITQRPSQYR